PSLEGIRRAFFISGGSFPMNRQDPALWAAIRIHRILCRTELRKRADSVLPIGALLAEQRQLERYWRLLQKARGWTLSVGILQKRLLQQVAEVHAASKAIHPVDLTLPHLKDIFEEIRHLDDDFDVVEIDKKAKEIAVTTDEVTLEEVRLGAFRIRMPFNQLVRRRDASAFLIVAEDPNAAAGDSSCIHPHVRDESLCAGDATLPISNALAQGRIGDAFQLVSRVLHTYNSGSAYVSLDDWNGQSCSDCGHTTSSDRLYFCESCQGDFCDDCMRSCERCEQSVCLGCSEENDNGDRLCPKCKLLDDKEREEAYEEEQTPEHTPVSDDPVHDPPEEEQPQPPTETTHEQSHSLTRETEQPPGAQLPGGTTDADGGRALTVAVPASLAA